ncbi:MAG: site-specific DNA-methyltransferase [Clostridium sp.]|nr:site-specific DNA-methyltransferase [Clostridium sp.]
MDNLNQYRELEKLLRMESRYCAEDGVLLKNAIVEAALEMRPDLIKMLLTHDALKRNFFIEIDGILVFDKVKFQKFVMNKRFLPDSYTSFKNKIGLTDDNGNFVSESREIVLSWPYKDCMLEGGQTKEDAKRNEVFWNEILAPDEINRLTEPKVLTGFVRYDKDGESLPTEVSMNDNYILKGNNLLTLYSLRKKYKGKINLIYIDPPFNTENDSFSYNDSFTRSTWLTFMRNRLEIAKDLLREDGNIFIHIDINQSHYLKVLCDDVFGKDNFVEEIIWAYGSPSGGRAATPKPVNIHDYILHYAKVYGQRKQNRVHIPYSEKYINDWFKFTDENGRVYRRRMRGYDDNGEAIWVRQYLDESPGIPLSTVWSDIQQVYADPRAYKAGNKSYVEVIKEFKGGQKPEALIARIIEMCTDENDIVLDFHLGTGTTAVTAMKMNRRFIGAEQMDSQIEIMLRRLPKVIGGDTAGISKKYNWRGGGSFVYCELATANQRFVDQLEAANTDDELTKIWADMQQSGFLSWKIEPKQIEENATDFMALSLDDKKRFLIECLDKNLLYIPLSEINNAEFGISDEVKKLNAEFYTGI